MIYIPSTELLSKMILASALKKSGLRIRDQYDILERFITVEKIKKRKKRVLKSKDANKTLNDYAKQNKTLKHIDKFDSMFCIHSDDIDTLKLGQFLPVMKRNKEHR